MLKKLIRRIQASFFIPYKMRPSLLRGGGYRVSSSAHIKSGCYFEGDHIQIENNVFINHDCSFYSYKNKENSLILLGDNVTIAMGVTLCTHTHESGDSVRRAGKTVARPIIVGEGSWIGANVTILPGVHVGKGCIIAAGSVVTKNCENNGMYAGVPATLKKFLE